PSGLSIPHARLEEYDGFVIVLGTSKDALSQEGRRINLMALMITSKWGSPYYLPVLAELARISRDEEYFTRLCGAEKPADFFNILRERDREIT
ncbi:MAG: PTS sugar transporter subunit IIA, partial [Treponema sp.]|nr:PTS sugar transporter subunit IIA [Treponema sp.]